MLLVIYGLINLGACGDSRDRLEATNLDILTIIPLESVISLSP